jgi:hypothetical protein
VVQPLITAAELDELRADAESLMVDTIAFRRRTGRTAQNEQTGREEPVYSDLFTSPCEVTGRTQGEVTGRTVTVGGVERVVLEGGVNIPVDAGELKAGDEGVITAVAATTDATVLGNTYRVVGFGGRTWATKRRLDVVEL